MIKLLKSVLIVLIILGLAFSFLNFISVDIMALNMDRNSTDNGTLQRNGDCLDDPLNC